MPRTAFPLSKSHSYPLGSTWDWRVVEATWESDLFRLLIAFDQAKQQYRAWLGHVRGHDTALLARLEYHPTHRGWHCHLKTGLLTSVVRGVVKDSRSRDKCRLCGGDEQMFKVSQLDAMNIAFRVFNISPSAAHSDDVLI